MVEASLSEEVRPPSGDKKGAETQAEDQTAFITQKVRLIMLSLFKAWISNTMLARFLKFWI